MNSLQIKTWVDEFSRLDDLSIDWLIKSFSLTGIDKKIARLYYKKAAAERSAWVKRSEELWKNQN